MEFVPTSLSGVWIVTLQLHPDERGFFARTSCEVEFGQKGLNTHWPQCSLTYTAAKGTLRGLHYQAAPYPEVKLVRCARGSIYDVVVDVRRESPTFGRWEGFELVASQHRQLYIPAGFAHGFQTLEDHCEVCYQISEFYHPDLARGVRWNDPTLNIPWPVSNPTLSARDLGLPLLTSAA
jgi:dTDP-4-dehydrorhamnose 3,5-epimerase